MSIYKYLLVLERKTHGRQLHLAKRFVPKRAFFSCKKGTEQIKTITIMICFVRFCQVKLSTTCLMLKNQQIPIVSALYTTVRVRCNVTVRLHYSAQILLWLLSLKG